MWINPPLRRIPSKCIISSCLSDYIIQLLQEVTETDIKDYISVRLKVIFIYQHIVEEGFYAVKRWQETSGWTEPPDTSLKVYSDLGHKTVPPTMSVWYLELPQRIKLRSCQRIFRCWNFVFINVGTINRNIIDIVIWLSAIFKTQEASVFFFL